MQQSPPSPATSAVPTVGRWSWASTRQGYMVAFDDSIKQPKMQADLAGIMFKWVNSTGIHCPLEFAERVAQEVDDATA